MTTALREELALWPKVDLHRHLEGTVRLATAWRWARRSPALAGASLDELRAAIQFDGNREFAHFLSKFDTLRELYHDPRAIEQVAREAVIDAAADRVRYLELRFSPDHFARQARFDPFEATRVILSAARDEAARQQIRVRFLCTIGRGYDSATARLILEIVLAFREQGIVGIDLAGDELQHPSPPFHYLVERARSEGLGITIHAGEVGPPPYVWQALNLFHANRIGHGIRSIEDPRLLETLREREIALEVCPTSNIQTGATASAETHPLGELVRSGTPVALSTDDPAISCITLTDEYCFAIEKAGLTRQRLATMVLDAARHAFLPAAEKQSLLEELKSELQKALSASERCKKGHDGPGDKKACGASTGL